MSTEKVILTKINEVIKKLRGLVLAANLLNLIYLRAQVCNVTRWSSIYRMVVRYTQIRTFLTEFESNEIDAAALAPSAERKVEALLKKLEPL